MSDQDDPKQAADNAAAGPLPEAESPPTGATARPATRPKASAAPGAKARPRSGTGERQPPAQDGAGKAAAGALPKAGGTAFRGAPPQDPYQSGRRVWPD